MISFYNKLNNLVKGRPPEENVAGSLSRLILSRERASNCIEALEARLQSAEHVVKAVRHIPRYIRPGKLNDAIDAYDKEYDK